MLSKGLEVKITGGSAVGNAGTVVSKVKIDGSGTPYYTIHLNQPAVARGGSKLPNYWEVYEKHLAPLNCSDDPNLAFKVSRRIS